MDGDHVIYRVDPGAVFGEEAYFTQQYSKQNVDSILSKG